MFESRFLSLLPRYLGSLPTAHHSFAAIAMCLLAGVGAYQLGIRSQDAVEQLQVELKAASRKDILLGGPVPAVQVHLQETDQWPMRQTVDEVVEQLSAAGLKQGLSIRSLAISHQAATPSSWGKVMLDISTTGSYAASKAWQAALMQSFPTLTVQNLRLQASPGSTNGLDAQWTWVLHVRD